MDFYLQSGKSYMINLTENRGSKRNRNVTMILVVEQNVSFSHPSPPPNPGRDGKFNVADGKIAITSIVMPYFTI